MIKKNDKIIIISMFVVSLFFYLFSSFIENTGKSKVASVNYIISLNHYGNIYNENRLYNTELSASKQKLYDTYNVKSQSEMDNFIKDLENKKISYRNQLIKANQDERNSFYYLLTMIMTMLSIPAIFNISINNKEKEKELDVK